MKALTKLMRLSAGATLVTSVQPLAGLTALETLLLFETHVTDLRPLAGLKDLESFCFSARSGDPVLEPWLGWCV